jgi:putative glutamine amidotransferase
MMQSAPMILVTPSTEEKGVEFYDYSLSLSQTYLDAISLAGGLPLTLPCSPSPKLISEFVRRANGVMITGGDDLQPDLYMEKVPANLRKTVGRTDPRRDLLETLLVKECFAQRKPLLAICRGHQILNVTLGGTLFVDIPTEVQTKTNHAQMKHEDRVTHDVELKPGTLIESIYGKQRISVNSSHHQSVNKVAPALHVTGRGDDDIIEVLELRPEDAELMPFLLGVQYHPERLVYGYPEHLELFRRFVGACTPPSSV